MREVVSDLKTFAHNGCKIAAARNFFFYRIFFICTLFKLFFLPPLLKVQCPNFCLIFLESLEKITERSGLRLKTFAAQKKLVC